ncbi:MULTISPECIES: hypothetical protein [Bradyrhizobium]|nr:MULTISPECIES: hypothetical protein [Bradyrhizobium]
MNRRSFLQGTSLTALASMAALAMIPTAVSAKMPLPAPSPTPTPTPTTTSGFTAATFNGGRSQVNLNFLQIGGDYPFLNCLKTAQSWALLDNSGYPDPATLDSDGYPTSITNGGVYTVFFIPPQIQRPGNYVVTWDGTGTIACNNGATVSGSTTSTNGRGRYVFSTTLTRLVIGISAIGNPRITNMKVFHELDEAAIIAGQVFGIKFKQRLMEANFGVIRFLNWQAGNMTNVTTWATRKPVSYVYYQGSEFRSGLYAGTTNNNGSVYTATLPNFSLVDKATIIVKFNASNSTASTLNVNGTGDINILSEYSGPLSSGGNSFPVAGTTGTLVYDATLNAWIKQGGDLAGRNAGLNNGCPPELMVRLCAEIGAHPYFVTPPLAIDPATDFMPSLAAYCRDNSPSWMIPRFEGPNETWNNSGGFFQTGYANAKAQAYGWGADYQNWYGKAMSVLGQIVSIAYGGNRTRYQVICGVQTAGGAQAGGTSGSNPRLASTKYLVQSTPAQSPYVKSAASNWVTHIAVANYIIPSEYKTAQETSDAAAYAAASGNPTLQQQIASNYTGTLNSGTTGFTLYGCAQMYANWKAWAKGFGVKKMCCYEGGYSPDYTGGGTSQVDLLRAASKQSLSLSGFTTTNYNNFVGLSDADFVAEFPSCFQLSGMTPSNGAWAVLENIYQAPNPPQWNAIVAFNH